MKPTTKSAAPQKADSSNEIGLSSSFARMTKAKAKMPTEVKSEPKKALKGYAPDIWQYTTCKMVAKTTKDKYPSINLCLFVALFT